MKTTAGGVDLAARVQEAKARLDAHVREIIEWHFSPETGCPFWLEFASRLVWSPRKEIRCFEDLKKFPPFQDDWLRGGPVRRWVPKGLTGRPVYIFETGGTTGVPKSRVAIERSEEHTSELQSPCNLVCRLLLEKKKKNYIELIQFVSRTSIRQVSCFLTN